MNFWRAMSKEFTYFKKPKNKNPTPHLWVANGGIKCGYNTSQLNEIFSKAGKIERIVTDDNESHSFVSFENPQDAISAKSLLVYIVVNFQLIIRITNSIYDTLTQTSCSQEKSNPR